ncbi:MAG: 50S ribosomal protein L18 [Candidatus Micrarchaeaceae archaeon]
MIRKRRKLSLTNYKKRVAMLKSGLPRLVVRKSGRSITLQIIRYEPDGDIVVMSANSRMLKQFGWEPRSNIPTAYLTGLLLARKSSNLNISEIILDIGLYRPIKGSVIFAAAKGAQDGGLKLKGSFEADSKRISGMHIAEYAKALDGERLKKQFAYEKTDPKRIDEAFKEVKEKIMVIN